MNAVAFDRSHMPVVPTLKERPPSREARRRRRDKKAKGRRRNLIKTVLVPVFAGVTALIVVAVTYLNYSDRRRETEQVSYELSEYENFQKSSAEKNRLEAARLLAADGAATEGGEAGEPGERARDIEQELRDREVERRRRELLGKDSPFIDVFGNTPQYLPDRDD